MLQCVAHDVCLLFNELVVYAHYTRFVLIVNGCAMAQVLCFSRLHALLARLYAAPAWRAWRAGLARLLLPVPPIAAAPVLHALMMSSLYWRVVNLGGAGEGGEKSKGGDLVITYAH